MVRNRSEKKCAAILSAVEAREASIHAVEGPHASLQRRRLVKAFSRGSTWYVAIQFGVPPWKRLMKHVVAHAQ